MKINFFLMSVCILFLFACNKKETTVQADLIGKWNVFETEVQVDGNVVVGEQGQGSNIIFINYVENGIEFFKDETFSMRIMNEDGTFRTYETLTGSHLTWEIEGDLMTLKYKHDSEYVSEQEYLLQFSLNNNILVLEKEGKKYRLEKE